MKAIHSTQKVTLPGSGKASCYVTNACLSADQSIMAVSSSTHYAYLFDANTMRQVYSTNVHKNTINCIRASSQSNNIWYSASSDRTVACFDSRVANTAIYIRFPVDVMSISLSLNETLLTAAHGTNVDFYDIRNISSSSSSPTSKLGTYEDLHSDMITQIEFVPDHPSLLVTAAEDGLICIHDTSIADEDAMTISTLSVDCPIRRFGLFGPHTEGLYCLSTVETLSLWHHSSSQRLIDLPDTRTQLQVEYLVDCCYNDASDRLTLVSGFYDGTGVVSELHPDPSALPTTSSQLRGGHTDVIRTFCRSVATGVCYSGGEDGVITQWKGI